MAMNIYSISIYSFNFYTVFKKYVSSSSDLSHCIEVRQVMVLVQEFGKIVAPEC